MSVDEPIRIHGSEQARFNPRRSDGGLPPVVGVHNIQVFRSCQARPDLADQEGWTYAHHQDLAAWQGRLYAAWAMTPKHEDVLPYRVVYATSTDGFRWTAPADLFPRDLAAACRFYFYRAANGRLLAFCAGRTADGTVREADKNSLLVREILADHTLGPVFTLIGTGPGLPASFGTAGDAGFVAACADAVANTLLLEQQDYGRFLGPRRMPWHGDPSLVCQGWAFGKAFCFYRRKDGVLVGLCKMGFVTLSDDNGRTWSRPVQPATLLGGPGKVWGQRTADGRYALAYNPDPARTLRHPIVLVHGDDGRDFRDMRVVHGELPPLRYPGQHKDRGPQYMRGLAAWADDGSFPDARAMWLIYSMNKEDIWISRIPLPIQPHAAEFSDDDFCTFQPSPLVPGWNLYSPQWAPVGVIEANGARFLELRAGDPADDARAVRVFPASSRIRLELCLAAAQTNARLDIEVCDAGGQRAACVSLAENGRLQTHANGTTMDLGDYPAGQWLTLVLTADLENNRLTLQTDDNPIRTLEPAESAVRHVERISLRTGLCRSSESPPALDAHADTPLLMPAIFRVRSLSLRPLQ